MKKTIISVLIITLLLSMTASAETIEINKDNFRQYFDISIDVSGFKVEKSLSYMGMDWYDAIGDVTVRIDAKYPFDIFGVNFTISAEGGASSNGLIGREENLTFKGTIPQSGSYSSTQSVKIDVGGLGPMFDGLSYKETALKVTQANGQIELKDETDNDAGATQGSIADELLKYGELLEKGLITQEEYDKLKDELLNH